ncbi:MAG TPA: alpha/beta fold hydrolase [Candidatus Limnocylindrales bacterium]|nr:alpha/beta fold hydrolase [Candidatus Limnocylindrales bacterium]
MDQPTTTTVQVDGGALFVRDIGSGPPILALHGGPDFDHAYLLPELDRLAGQFRLVYYDQRGRGRSFHGEGPDDVTMESEMDDADRVRAWTRSDTVALLGHSWGGLLAMEYAIRHPDRVSHVVLIDTAPASHQDMLELRRHLRSLRSPEQLARMGELASDPAFLTGDPDATAEYNRIHFAPTIHRSQDLDMVVARFYTASTPQGIVAAREIEESLYAQTWSNEAYDLFPSLRELRIPTLVIRGEHDFIPESVSRRIAASLQPSRFVAILDAGHFAFVEQPEMVRSAIAEFLAPA